MTAPRPSVVLPPAARRAAALTLAGLWWERLARSFWAAGTLAALALAALALGVVGALPGAALPWVAGAWVLAFCAAAFAGWRRFRRPTDAEALVRVDQRLPGRPLSALGDRIALVGPGAEALWRAHLAQASAAAAQARPVAPDAGLVTRDPYALRLIGLTALAMALIFGGTGPAGQGLAALAAGWKPATRAAPPETVVTGPSWEGWAEPPRYTRRPTIYLNALKDDALTVPEGTVFSFRLYGEGAGVEQDVGEDVAVTSPVTGALATQSNGAVPATATTDTDRKDTADRRPAADAARSDTAATRQGQSQPGTRGATGHSGDHPPHIARSTAADTADPDVSPRATASAADGQAMPAPQLRPGPGSTPQAPRFVARHDGTIRVGGRNLAITVTPDAAPTVQLAALAERRADGRMAQGFSAADDNGVSAGRAEITLDLAAADRRHGLTPDPEPREALTLALPLPGAGARKTLSGTLAADLARHPWANLPVRIRLSVEDGIGQRGETDPVAMVLPGRRFFDPFAAGVAEMRRDLLWSRDNAARSGQLLRAMVWNPDRPVPPEAATAIVAAIRTLEGPPLTPEARDQLADALWDAAIMIEDGGLSDALARMQQAQERLSEAIRGGASKDEIQKLMDELKAATDAYTEKLAEQGEDPSARFDRSTPPEMLTGDRLQEMMDEIQRLMNEGRMAEAQELLQQFNELMQNLQVRNVEGGGSSGSRPMQRMGDALREQQKLADEALREAQRDPFGQQRQPDAGQSGGQSEGQSEGQQDGGQQDGGAQERGQAEGGQPGDQQGSLADRQRSLREEIGRQRGLLPSRGTPEGEAAGQALDQAGRAMREAEQALRDGDPAGAMDGQAAAIEALRQGMRALGRMERQGQQGDDGATQPGEGEQPGQQGSAQANAGEGFDPSPRRDPLGRDSGGQGSNITTGEALAEGERQAGRARELQDEIRRRSGDRERPRAERDYLGRLLDGF